MRNFVYSVIVFAALAFVPACSDDDPVQPTGLAGFLPLTTRDAVLNNLEVAWDNRVPSKIDELLDDNFTFYFSPGDVGGGLPVQWPRTDELQATNDLFISNREPVPVGPECQSVRIDLSLDEVTWDPIAAPANALGETWYTAAVYYNFTFKMAPDDTYSSEPGAQAQLTVREVAVGNGTEWRLVEWRDLGNSLVVGARQNSSTNESTWGGIKALYRD